MGVYGIVEKSDKIDVLPALSAAYAQWIQHAESLADAIHGSSQTLELHTDAGGRFSL